MKLRVQRRVWLLTLFLAGLAVSAGAQLDDNGFRTSVSTTNTTEGPDAAHDRWEQLLRETGGALAVRETVVTRVSGPSIMPFTLEKQAIIAKAIENVLIPALGPVTIISYRENYPEPGFSEEAGVTDPYVDFAGNMYRLFNLSMPDLNDSATWTKAWTNQMPSFGLWVAEVQRLGLNASFRLMSINIAEEIMTQVVRLAPVVPVEVMVAVSTAAGTNLTALQASTIAETLEDLVGAHIDIMAWSTQDALKFFDATFDYGNGSQLMVLDISLPACESANGTGWESCALSTLQFKLLDVFVNDSVLATLAAGGMAAPRLAGIRLRPSPQPPAQPQVPAAVPWHLDRLDQRTLPLDGQYAADNLGSGVSVYVLSAGIDATHSEFQRTDGVPGTRIKPGWGFNGTDPLQDCPDAFAWYGFGTYYASLIGGNTLGVAKNATITSVRYRYSCLMDAANIWAPEGLPSGFDYVLSTAKGPSVMLIETWWGQNRYSSEKDDFINQALHQRVQLALAQNITIIIPAGIGLCPICENILAAHPDIITVQGVDVRDQLSSFAESNSSCLSLLAPGGGMGNGVLGAMAQGNLTTILPQAFGAASLVAGLAAQYLSNNPAATPAQVKRALLAAATQDRVLLAGSEAHNRLAYTDLTFNATVPDSGAGPGGEGGGGGGLSTAAILGLALPLGALLLLAVGGGLCYGGARLASRRGAALVAHRLDGEWEIAEKRIKLVRRADGEPWQLGHGSHGPLYKAVKDGVQVVAVRPLRCGGEGAEHERCVREIAMMRFLSRDANITQFYGAVVGAQSLTLVAEFMAGGDLRAAIDADARGRLAWWAGGKGVALDVTRGLHFLHTLRVAHRDVKSGSVLLTRDGRAKLSDVGMARVVGEQAPDDGFVGTQAWAAPELLAGQAYDERVDIWSLGTLLWEIVTREVPMRGMLRPPLVPEECPQEVADVIAACMQRDPARRPDAHTVYTLLLEAEPATGAEAAGAAPDAYPGSGSVTDCSSVGTPRGGTAPSPLSVISNSLSLAEPLRWTATPTGSRAQSKGSAVHPVSPQLRCMVDQIQRRFRHHEAMAAARAEAVSPRFPSPFEEQAGPTPVRNVFGRPSAGTGFV